jgi:(S)-ureidoglycine-glyoxylate aminotransferase
MTPDPFAARLGALDPPRRLLMGSGPSNAEPRVLRAMGRPPLPPGHPDTGRLLDELATGLQAVFTTQTPYSVALPGASRSGLEAALASLVEHGDHVLVGVYGHFGELLCTLAQRHGAVVERVESEAWGTCVDPDLFIAKLKASQPKLAAIVHADTSTGIVQPLEAIGRACREQGTLLLVDAVLSIGGCELQTDAWCLDVVGGGLQKCLGGPPGLAPMVCSERTHTSLVRRRHKPHSAYLDLRRAIQAWQDRPPEHVPATPMLYALAEALAMVQAEGLAARWQRHEEVGAALKAGLQAMGLRLFGDERHRAPMIAIVEVPDGVSEAGVRQQLLEDHGIEIMAAFGPLRGRVWRIGSMGANARMECVLAVLSALESVLASRGVHLKPGAGVRAARARASGDDHAPVARLDQQEEAVRRQPDGDHT